MTDATGTRVDDHTAYWRDGMRVTRFIIHRGTINMGITWKGRQVELRIGKRALYVKSRDKWTKL